MIKSFFIVFFLCKFHHCTYRTMCLRWRGKCLLHAREEDEEMLRSAKRSVSCNASLVQQAPQTNAFLFLIKFHTKRRIEKCTIQTINFYRCQLTRVRARLVGWQQQPLSQLIWYLVYENNDFYCGIWVMRRKSGGGDDRNAIVSRVFFYFGFVAWTVKWKRWWCKCYRSISFYLPYCCVIYAGSLRWWGLNCCL